MAKSGPRKTNRYSHEFKATAVRLSDLPDVLIQDVADALDIHPFMLVGGRAGMVRSPRSHLPLVWARYLACLP